MKIGIIGCGRIAQERHIPEYAAHPGAELFGYYDFVASRAEEMAKQYGGRAFTSVEELLECAEIDAVSVCTANNAHAQTTIAALRAGKHVLCEKPMATSMEECEAMAAEARRSGKVLMIAQNQRFMSEHVKAKELLALGVIGRILTFRTCFGHSGPDHWSVDRGTGNWFFDKRQSVFGCMADLGIHKTDLIQFLLDSEVEKVKAMTDTLDKCYADGSRVDVEDNAVCLFRLKNGVIGTMTASWTYYGEEENGTVLYGTDGSMKIRDGSVEVCLQSGDRVLYRMPPRSSSGVIDAFLDCLICGGAVPVSGERVLSAMRAVFAALDAAKEK
ncbi:MAG: Gfo/Idh/MocA family oxidoreductase [Clostridia bacterium]|nr:Gfo/Idh/MocA family oxidoreductase [Clostridia bacterium]